MAKCIYCKNPSCNLLFETKWFNQQYCSDVCNHMDSNNPSRTAMNNIKQQNIIAYTLNYNTCNNCKCCLLYEIRHNKFCSSSCAAIFNNSNRKPRSIASRKKVSNTLTQLHYSGLECEKFCELKYNSCKLCTRLFSVKSKINYLFCSESCKRIFKNKDNIKTINNPNICHIHYAKCLFCSTIKIVRQSYKLKYCSKQCQNSASSIRTSNYLKNNRSHIRGPHKPSYMEESFASWLKQNYTDKWYSEVYFWNHELKKNGWADFVFPKEKLIIELDGSQHRKTVEKDQIRDEYLLRDRGYKVYRITHKDYVKQIRINEVKVMLGIKIR